MNNYLIVVDMQNDFIDGALGTEEAKAIVINVIDKVKNYEGTIIFTRDSHDEDYLTTQEGQNLPKSHCIKNTYGWEIQEDLKEIQENLRLKVFNKETFGSKELINYLIKENDLKEINEIQIIGLCTDICVISNALTIKTFLPDVKIVVDEKCCAGVTVESHINAINAMRVCQVEII